LEIRGLELSLSSDCRCRRMTRMASNSQQENASSLMSLYCVRRCCGLYTVFWGWLRTVRGVSRLPIRRFASCAVLILLLRCSRFASRSSGLVSCTVHFGAVPRLASRSSRSFAEFIPLSYPVLCCSSLPPRSSGVCDLCFGRVVVRVRASGVVIVSC
jgi:hypothetical protein